MKREELLKSKDYVRSGMQLKLLNLIEGYMKKNGLKRNELAKELKVTKGYISQLLNVSYNHKLSKIVELALACNSMPLLFFVDLDRFIKEDAKDKIFELMPMQRPRLMTYNYENKSSLMVNEETKKQPFTIEDYLNRHESYFKKDSAKSKNNNKAVVININEQQTEVKLIS